jgi:hypothetical protein
MLSSTRMNQALQVSFRQLVPSEGLVGLAATRYRRLGQVVRGPSQCVVCLETLGGRPDALTLAHVRLERPGAPWAQAEARHHDPYTALDAALSSLEAQLQAGRWPN